MKEQILKLRAEGKSYSYIKKTLKCSIGTISYHCGVGQKEKTRGRNRKRNKNVLLSKVDGFIYKKYEKPIVRKKEFKNKKDVVEGIRKFQKRDNSVKKLVNKQLKKTFSWEDVVNKFGENTVCYLSGEKINLYVNNYQLDHVIPSSRKGDNSFDNLGILHEIVNQMKGNLTPEELVEWCKKILIYNGYNVNKK